MGNNKKNKDDRDGEPESSDDDDRSVDRYDIGDFTQTAKGGIGKLGGDGGMQMLMNKQAKKNK